MLLTSCKEECECCPIPNPNPNAINNTICTCYLGVKLTEDRKNKLIESRGKRHDEWVSLVGKASEDYNSLNNTERATYEARIAALATRGKETYSQKKNKCCFMGCCSLFCWEDDYRN